MNDRPYLLFDVFTDRPFAGNPLAVVAEADGLDAAAMQTIAREFNLSETVYLLPPTSEAADLRLRIFTPTLEMPFAGHPTIGGAVGAALLGLIRGHATLEEIAGTVPVDVVLHDGERGEASFIAPEEPRVSGRADAAPLLRALALDPGIARGPALIATAGSPFVFVELPDRASLSAIRLDAASLARALPGGTYGCVVWCRGEVDGIDRHVRMFAPEAGVPEDPATGSAAAAMAAVAHAGAPHAEGEVTLHLSQGVEMGRPSMIRLGVIAERGMLRAARIGGSAVLVGRGRIRVPPAG